MRGAAERGHLVIGLGDFNMIPQSLAHRLISTHSPVKDIWAILHPDSSIGAAEDLVEKARQRPVPTARFNLTENGATCDSVLNTWRWEKSEQEKLGRGKPGIEVSLDTLDPKSKRLDYIFANTGHNEYKSDQATWEVQTAKVGMTEYHPELQCSLTDHYSVECTLVRSGSSNGHVLKENISHSQDGSKTPLTSTTAIPSKHLPLATYDDILNMIATYTARERFQRRFRLGNFLLSLIVSFGCWTAIWWSPKNYVSFLLILLSSLGLAAGVIDGLIGGLFVGSEIRALKEFEWEIRNAKAKAEGLEKGRADGTSDGGFMEGREGVVDW